MAAGDGSVHPVGRDADRPIPTSEKGISLVIVASEASGFSTGVSGRMKPVARSASEHYGESCLKRYIV